MSDLDQLFKNKLKDRSFEFKEEYWQAAEQLIIDEEDKGRRRGVWWWIFGAIGLIALFAGVYFYAQVEPARMAKANNEKEVATGTSTNPTHDPLSSTIAPTITEAATRSKTEAHPIASATEVVEVEAGNVAAPKASDVFAASPSEYKKPSALSIATKNSGNLITIDQDPESTNRKLTTHKITNTNTNTETNSNATPVQPIKTDRDLITDTKKQDGILPADRANIRALVPLETIAQSVKSTKAPEALPTDAMPAPIVKRSKVKSLRIGVEATSMVSITNNYKGYSGISVGAMIDYRLNRDWSLQSGLRYSIRTPDHLASSASDVDNFGLERAGFAPAGFTTTSSFYNFGLVEVTQVAKINRFHFIELPVALYYQRNRHSIGLGLQLNFLSGIRGEQFLSTEVATVDSNSFPTAGVVSASNSKGWLDRSAFQKWSSELMLQYRYQLTSNWRLTAGVNYHLFNNGLVRRDTVDSASLSNDPLDQTEINANPLYLRVGAQYLFK